MELAKGVAVKIKAILTKLKRLRVIRSFTLTIDYGNGGGDAEDVLAEIDALLQGCVERMLVPTPRQAEIRNVISELVRKKNTNEDCQSESLDPVQGGRFEFDNNSFDPDDAYCLCEFCGDDFRCRTNLMSHILRFHSDDDGKESKGLMTGHGGEEARRFACSSCGKLFRKEPSLKKHIRLSHSRTGDSGPFPCNDCGKTFSERRKLNRHRLSHDRGEFACSECQRVFHRSDNLRRHVRLSHGLVDTFECRFCKKTFSLSYNRDAHENNVHMGNEIQCEFCGKKCKNKATFRIHRKQHEGTVFGCTLCPRTFTRKSHYQYHLKKRHTGFSPFQKLFDTFVDIADDTPAPALVPSLNS